MIDISAHKIYKAYSLLEMLVVMSIIIVIMGIGFGTFAGLNSSISLNETLSSLKQDIKNTQRSAMFVERNSDERWLYGLGIDFSKISVDGSYRIFKWCSQFTEYGDVLTTSYFPNYDSNDPVSILNGNLPVNAVSLVNNCPLTSNSSVLVSQVDQKRYISKNLIGENDSLNATGDVGNIPMYIVFESVSGRAFMYDSNGILVNYAPDGDLIDANVELNLLFESKSNGVQRGITIDNISGRINEYKK